MSLLVLLGVLFGWTLRGAARAERPERNPFRDTGRLYRETYSRRGFLRLGLMGAGAAVLAHTGVDEAVDRWHSEAVRSDATDRASHWLHDFGERPWFLYWGVFALADAYLGSTALTRWGRRNFQSMIVGLPALWAFQYGGGGSRPTDALGAARWQGPLKDDNTASGHAFIAAVPWLNAGVEIENRWVHAGARVLSLGTGWSRLNDRKHYVGQVLLGYGIADQVCGRDDVDSTESAAPSNCHDTIDQS